ncbi:MAG: PDZ domain-containing protein [Gammaproteobacteria bacterium]|nr:PDZ domain-containing protein [Gammaproteobacteria bacterium]
MGISGYMLSLEKQQELGLRETGLSVTGVNKGGSPLQANDVILAISGQSFATLAQARKLIQGATGNQIQVRVHRNGAAMELSVPLK